MLDNTDRPNVEETYISATVTSDLRVEGDRFGAGDVLIASGWSPTRLGGALLRLHTDWDRAEKPARVGFAAIERMAEEIRADDMKQQATAKRAGTPYQTPPPAMTRARSLAHDWYTQEMANLTGKLKALPAVHTQITIKFKHWSAEDAARKAAALIRWWLNQVCPVCSGTKLQVVEGTHRHGNKVCKECSGTGLREVPHGQEGRRMANYLDSCVEDWTGSVSRNLSNMRPKSEPK
jgi:hypothetical protein